MTDDQIRLLIRTLDEPKWTEVVSTVMILISAGIAIFALLYARRQIKYARDQIETARHEMVSDHKRSQRKTAMEMCIKWSEFNAPETSSVTRLVEQLDPKQIAAISAITSLVIDVGHKHNILNILQRSFPGVEQILDSSITNGNFVIEGQHLQHIRHIAVRYLNMLESILLAWAEGIADHEVILKEFKYLLDETQSRTAMRALRTKLGIKAFPSIELFMTAVTRRNAGEARDGVHREPLVAETII